MLFVLHMHDRADGSEKRKQLYPAHHAFLGEAEKFGVTIVMSGPLTSDDGTTPIGSHFVVEAPSRTMVEAFHNADPFCIGGVWQPADIAAFTKRRG